MPKTVTYTANVELHIIHDAAGNPLRGNIVFSASNGARESVTVGPGGDFDVDFGTLGTATQRTAFRAIVAALISAGRLEIGDV